MEINLAEILEGWCPQGLTHNWPGRWDLYLRNVLPKHSCPTVALEQRWPRNAKQSTVTKEPSVALQPIPCTLPTNPEPSREEHKALRAGGHTLVCRTQALMYALLPTYTAHSKPAQRRCPSPAEFLRSHPGKPTHLCIPLVSTKPRSIQVESPSEKKLFYFSGVGDMTRPHSSLGSNVVC